MLIFSNSNVLIVTIRSSNGTKTNTATIANVTARLIPTLRTDVDFFITNLKPCLLLNAVSFIINYGNEIICYFSIKSFNN